MPLSPISFSFSPWFSSARFYAIRDRERNTRCINVAPGVLITWNISRFSACGDSSVYALEREHPGWRTVYTADRYFQRIPTLVHVHVVAVLNIDWLSVADTIG